MSRTAIEELLNQCNNSAYKLVILATKRAKELAGGAPVLVKSKLAKITSLALEEIRTGKVVYQEEGSEGGSGKKGRGKAKDTKKKRTTR